MKCMRVGCETEATHIHEFKKIGKTSALCDHHFDEAMDNMWKLLQWADEYPQCPTCRTPVELAGQSGEGDVYHCDACDWDWQHYEILWEDPGAPVTSD